jgi:hypothetical protein
MCLFYCHRRLSLKFPNWFYATTCPDSVNLERVWNLIQIAILILPRLLHPLHRSPLDLLPAVFALQYHFQSRLPRLLQLCHLPHAQRLQTHARPQPRHLQSRVSARWLSTTRDSISIQVHASRSIVGILDLVGSGSYLAAAVYAAENRRGGDYYNALPLCVGSLSSAVYPELDLPMGNGSDLE